MEIVTYKATNTDRTAKRVREDIVNSEFIKQPYVNEDTGESIFISANVGRKPISNPGWMNAFQMEMLPEMIRTAKFAGKTKGREGAAGNLAGTYMFFGAMRRESDGM